MHYLRSPANTPKYRMKRERERESVCLYTESVRASVYVWILVNMEKSKLENLMNVSRCNSKMTQNALYKQ